MADEQPQTIRAIHWRDVFPFLNLFRAFRVAIHPSKLVLGLLALLTIYAGGRILDGLWSWWAAPYQPIPGELDRYQEYSAAPDRAVPFTLLEAAERARRTDEYAGLLRNRGLVTDQQKSAAAAANYDHYSDLKARIFQKRDQSVRDAADELNRANKQIDDNKSLDDAAKGREHMAARAEYENAVRAAFSSAHDDARRLELLVPRGVFHEFFEYEMRQVNDVVYGVMANNWTGSAGAAAEVQQAIRPPVSDRLANVRTSRLSLGVFPAVLNFFTVGPSWLFRYHLIYAILFTLLFLLVWAVFGGAICRIAAVHVARDEKISVRQALRFSVSKVLSFVFAPVIPLLIVLGIGVVLAVGGLLFYLPWGIGSIVASALMIFAFLGGLVITLVLFGTVGGLNLMYPTIAVEGSDSFDAISRSFSYVFARPWRMLFYTAVAVAYGALAYLFVKFFAYVVLASTHYFVGWWLGGQPGRWFPEMWPAPSFASLPYNLDLAGLAWPEAVAAVLISICVYLIVSLVGAFAISFYFSASTIIYYLMRREVDATELEDVYVEEADDDLADTGPVVPASVATVTTTSSGTVVVTPSATATGSTSAPGGGVGGTAGSSPPGGSGGSSYTAPATDNPATTGGNPTE
jgi:hypothetical protein